MLRCLPHFVQFPRQPRDLFRHAAAVDFQLRFTRTPHADAAALPRQVRPHAGQPRQQILQLRQLDLQLAVLRLRALRKNIENQLRPIQNLPLENLLQIAALRGTQLIVENHRADVLLLAKLRQFARLARPDVIGRRRRGPPLDRRIHHLAAGALHQFAQFLQRLRVVPLAVVRPLQTHQKGALVSRRR